MLRKRAARMHEALAVLGNIPHKRVCLWEGGGFVRRIVLVSKLHACTSVQVQVH